MPATAHLILRAVSNCPVCMEKAICEIPKTGGDVTHVCHPSINGCGQTYELSAEYCTLPENK